MAAEVWLRIVSGDVTKELLEAEALEATEDAPFEVYVERDPVISALAAARRAEPDWRAGQTIINATRTVTDGRSDPFMVSDDALVEGLGKAVS